MPNSRQPREKESNSTPLSTAVCPMGFKSLEVLQNYEIQKGSCIFVELPLRSSVFCTSRRALLRTNWYMANRPVIFSMTAELTLQVCWASFLLNHCARSRFCSCLLFKTELCTRRRRISVTGTLSTLSFNTLKCLAHFWRYMKNTFVEVAFVVYFCVVLH